eukprot:sb/3473867/
MAFIFVFNLLLGAGALSLPVAFAEAGWIVSTILLGILCFASFVSASFMCEGMAIANVLYHMTCPKKNDGGGGPSTETEPFLAASFQPKVSKLSNEHIVKRRFLGYRFIQERPILLKFEYNKWQVAIYLVLKFQSKISTTFDAMSI